MHCVCPHQRCSLRHSVLNVAMSEYLATFGLESGRVCACSSESQRSASRRATHTGPSPGGPRGQGDTRPRPVSPFPPPRLGSPSPRPDFHTCTSTIRWGSGIQLIDELWSLSRFLWSSVTPVERQLPKEST